MSRWHGGLLFAVALAAAACSDSATAPGPDPRADGEFESWVLSTVGVTTDQANASSMLGDAAWILAPLLRPSDAACAFDAASGRVTCSDVTINGLTISRSFAFYDAAGDPQAFRGPTTVRVNTRTWVRGTVERDSVTATIDRRSDLTVTGVQPGSTRRTFDGVEEGTSSIVARLARGTFVSDVRFADTTRGLVLAANDPTAPRWPLGGTVIRSAEGTRSREGGDSQFFSRREEIVFDGTSRASLTITVNGQTRSCIIDLAARRVNCS